MRKILLVILFIGLVPTAGQGAAPRSPQIDITPASPFAFPNTVPGAMSRQIFKVTNLTRASIQTQVLIRANGNFTYNWRVANSCGMPGLSSRFLRRVGPGQSCNVEIIFSPKLAGVHSHSVQIRALDLRRRRIINTTVLSLQGPSRPPLLPASQVTQVNPPVAASGQDVFFEGKGLEQIREVKFGDTSAVFNFDQANGIFSVTVPVGLSRGEHSVVVNGVIQVPKLRLEPFCSSDGLIVENKSLFITHGSVINHARATFSGGSGSEWSFAHLMGKMAGVEDSDEQRDQKTSEFIKDWFDTFSNPGTELRIEGRDIWRLMGSPYSKITVNELL